MAYGITIHRDPPLTLSEWKAVVMSTAGVRLDGSGASTTNPSTSEVISMKGADGDAQIFLDDAWFLFFLWRPSGEVVFKASQDFENPRDPIRTLARNLAKRLNAELIGEGGEGYA